MKTPVAIALGSNLGNRQANVDWAVSRLRSLLDGLMVSTLIETDPVDVPQDLSQNKFINAVATGHTDLGPRDLLAQLHAIEEERGRVRTRANEPRLLDLDLILYGNLRIDEPDFTVPHPRFRERAFVLDPLSEIAPGWADPVSGKTVAELAKALQP